MGATAHEVAEFLYREAAHLDAQRWDDWLALFDTDCEFWVPAWRSEHRLTNDPRAELSLVYYRNRAGLEERVLRVKSGRSPASSPLPRTHHAISNVLVQASDADVLTVASTWTLHEFHTGSKQTNVRFGRYEHQLRRSGDGWTIRKKHVVIVNDYMPASVDFYNM
jgi:3-phenylpropionate/cinnamic acid dioxygenase small subunit